MWKFINTIRNLIKFGTILTVDDSTNRRSCIIDFDGKKQTVCLFMPYGLFASVPEDSIGATFAQNADDSSLFTIADKPESRPVRNLEQGEVGVGNYITSDYILFDNDGNTTIQSATGSYIKFLSDGSIEMKSNSGVLNIVDTDINLNTGEITGTNVFSGKSSKNHIHSGVTSGGQTTGGTT